MRLPFVVLLLVAAGLLAGCGKDDQPAAPPSGIGSMRITVMSGETAMALATVVVSAVEVSEETSDRMATTDLNGEAMVTGLPAGTYSVTAAKSVAGMQHSAQNTSVSVVANSTTTVVLVLLASRPDYFPMTLGNWWAYDSGDTIWVGPTKVIDGVTTLVVGPPGQDVHPGYHTHGRNAIYQHGYETLTGEDHIIRPPTVWIDLTATAGECWTIRDWGQGCLESEWETVQTPLGEFTDCWKVKLQSDDSYGWYLYLKPGIGPVKLASPGKESWLLTDFKLN